MLTLHYENGGTVQLRFVGDVSSEEDIAKFVDEMRLEIALSTSPIHIHIWSDAPQEPRPPFVSRLKPRNYEV